jgi:hypothetical protein
MCSGYRGPLVQDAEVRCVQGEEIHCDQSTESTVFRVQRSTCSGCRGLLCSGFTVHSIQDSEVDCVKDIEVYDFYVYVERGGVLCLEYRSPLRMGPPHVCFIGFRCRLSAEGFFSGRRGGGIGGISFLG